LVAESGCLSRRSGGACKVSWGKELVELTYENVICSGKFIFGSHFEGKSPTIRDMLSPHDKFNQVLFFNVDGEDLANFIDAYHSISGHISDWNKNQLFSDPLAVN